MEKQKRVLVALSGGVDSSLSAALLIDEGYAVEGAFIKTWTVPWLPCTWREERRDAMRVSAQLGIPFHTIDLSNAYEEEVVQYMIHSYECGYTPNPDVMCNKYIKFGGLYDWAMEQGFDYIATGHYARTRKDGDAVRLLSGKDKQKDQTYFLWTLTDTQLAHVLFPVGEYQKSAVRERAMLYNLSTAQKKDSQGICFLGKVDMKEFLSHYTTARAGLVLDTRGEIIGKHDGALFFTLGQRHGFTIYQRTPHTPPLYVIDKNIEQNTITVASTQEAHERAPNTIALKDVHFIQSTYSHDARTCMARIRYRQPLFEVTLEKREGTTYTATVAQPQPYVSPGQSMVFYDGDVCLGGGIVSKTRKQ
jgi:tRNA-specific 2-thiouridylase